MKPKKPKIDPVDMRIAMDIIRQAISNYPTAVRSGSVHVRSLGGEIARLGNKVPELDALAIEVMEKTGQKRIKAVRTRLKRVDNATYDAVQIIQQICKDMDDAERSRRKTDVS